MGSNRMKRISIHDYPEHLNPFSESNQTVQNNRRIFVDRLRKNSTWSSKISKRVSRSVTWIEKSWLPIEESRKGYRDSRMSDNLDTREYDSRVCVKSNPAVEQVLQTEHDSSTKHDGYQQTRTRELNELDNRKEMSVNDYDNTKPETKKRKKRPAPPPPPIPCTPDSNSSPSEERASQTFCPQEQDGFERNSEDVSPNEPGTENHIQVNVGTETKSDLPVNNLIKENRVITEADSLAAEKSSEKTLECASRLSDHLANLNLDSAESGPRRPSKSSENERLEISTNGTCRTELLGPEEVLNPTSENAVLDENGNISCSKLEKSVSDSTFRIHCNGNAVQV